MFETLGEIDIEELDYDLLEQIKPKSQTHFSGFELYYPKLSKSPEIQKIYSLINKVAVSNASVLIQGETGSGKELIAGAIQALSLRADKPYVTVNCAAIPEHLLESELFGHDRGAFTGAVTTHIGKFEQADGGTLFLDEIGDMHPTTQAKILRVLQEQSFTRIGGQKVIRVDVRIIAATNKDLWQEIESGRFRPDLYYRLNVVTVQVPPLRERREDVPLLADYFKKKFAAELKKNIGNFTPEGMELLANHSWPGNIRELRNLIERAVLVTNSGEDITPKDLALTGKDYFAAGGRDRRREERGPSLPSLRLEELERMAVTIALERSKWIQKDAAELLGISPRALNYKVSQLGIAHAGWRKNVV
ncbi:sigma-54-dependent Fis family transcriptional regulator [bacterium]|nr:sigma-54-dependent Fis family transcriptional regulator [bacterium]